MPAPTRQRTRANDRNHYLNVRDAIVADWISALDEFDPNHEIIENPELIFPQIVDMFLFVPKKTNGKPKQVDINRELIMDLFKSIFIENVEASGILAKRLAALVDDPKLNRRFEPHGLVIDKQVSTLVALLAHRIDKRFTNEGVDSQGLIVLNSLNLLPCAELIRNEKSLISALATALVDTDPEFEPSEFELDEKNAELREAVSRMEEHRVQGRIDFLLELVDLYELSQRETLQELDDRKEQRKKLEEQHGEEVGQDLFIGPLLPSRREIRNAERRMAEEERAAARLEAIELRNAELEAQRRAQAELGAENAADRAAKRAIKDAEDAAKKAAEEAAKEAARKLTAEARTKSLESLNANRELVDQILIEQRIEKVLDSVMRNHALAMVLFRSLAIETNYHDSFDPHADINEQVSEGYALAAQPHTIWFDMTQIITSMKFATHSDDVVLLDKKDLLYPLQLVSRGLLGRAHSLGVETVLLEDVIKDYKVAMSVGVYPSSQELDHIERIASTLAFGLNQIVDVLKNPMKFEELTGLVTIKDWDGIIGLEKLWMQFSQLSLDDLNYLSEIFSLPVHGILYRAASAKNIDLFTRVLERRDVSVTKATSRVRNAYATTQAPGVTDPPHQPLNLDMNIFGAFCHRVLSRFEWAIDPIKNSEYIDTLESELKPKPQQEYIERLDAIIPLQEIAYTVMSNSFLINRILTKGTEYEDLEDSIPIDLKNKVNGYFTKVLPTVYAPHDRWTHLGHQSLLRVNTGQGMNSFDMRITMSAVALDVMVESIQLNTIMNYVLSVDDVPLDVSVDSLILELREAIALLEKKMEYLESMFFDIDPNIAQFNSGEKVWHNILNHDYLFQMGATKNPKTTPSMIERIARRFHMKPAVAQAIINGSYGPQVIEGTLEESFADLSPTEIKRHKSLTGDSDHDGMIYQAAFGQGTIAANIFGTAHYGVVLNPAVPQKYARADTPEKEKVEYQAADWANITAPYWEEYESVRVEPEEINAVALLQQNLMADGKTYFDLSDEVRVNRVTPTQTEVISH